MLYILVVEDEVEIREFLEMAISAAFPLKVILAHSGNEALRIIREKGNPEIIISDFRMPDGDGLFLYQSLQIQNLNIPFVICSANSTVELQQLFPQALGFVEKPKIISSVIKHIERVVARSRPQIEYVPLRISFLQRLGQLNFDLYMKLSEDKYIKVLNSDETFLQEDAARFSAKKLDYLYLHRDDCLKCIKVFEDNLNSLTVAQAGDQDGIALSMDSLEMVERIAFNFGWTQEMVSLAQKSVLLSIKVLGQNYNIFRLLQERMKNSTSNYSRHVTLQSMLTCLFCQHLGWVSESTQLKMGMASLMHDIAVDEKYYEDIQMWDQMAGNKRDKSPEFMKYRSHPIEAVNVLHHLSSLPPDVDQIILQHHESKDGSGFPRGLTAQRISPLSSLFIITEDLVNSLGNGEQLEQCIQKFFTEGDQIYTVSNFKKIFSELKEKVLVR